MFATLFGMVRSMLNEACTPMILRRGIWAEAACTATDMRNYLVSYKSDTSSYEKFMGAKYDCIDTLHTFCEMAIIEDHPTRGIRAKLQDRGRPVMFVGTTHEHTSDTYHFLSVITKQIIASRDIIWTGKSYGEYYNINTPQLPALPTRILLDKPSDGPVTAWEVHAPPGLSNVVDEEEYIENLSNEDDFIAEKKLLTKLKKFIPTILPIPNVDKPVIPKGVEPGRVLTQVELVNILYPMPTFKISGYSFVMGPKVFTKEAAYDDIKPIKYKDMFEVPLTFEQTGNHPCPCNVPALCWK
jgi:hypothetical protein